MLNNERISSLMRRIQNRDPLALDEFLRQVAPTLQRYGLRMCRNEEDAQDIAQESLIAAVRNLDGFRGEASVSTWLYTIARSFCIKKRRRKKGSPESMETLHDAIPATADRADEQVQRRDFEQALERVLNSLEESQREVFMLRDIEGLSAKEVAGTLGISEAAVKSRLHRVRDNVRRAMAEWFERPAQKTAEKCPQAKSISLMFSRFLEGELDAATCTSLKRHVSDCPDCKPVCDCLQRTLRLCEESGKDEPLSQELIEKMREAILACTPP